MTECLIDYVPDCLIDYPTILRLDYPTTRLPDYTTNVYNSPVPQSRHLPNFDRLSALLAAVLLAYATARFIAFPVLTFNLALGGIFLPLSIGVNTVVAVVVAGMTAMGIDGLLHSHPRFSSQSTYEHWLLPALTAWVVSVPLSRLPLSPVWWLAFGLGGLLLLAVLVAEFIVVDTEDARHYPAAAGLTALSFALFLILVITLRTVGFRLLLQLPAVALTAFLVSLRAIHLQSPGAWQLPQAAAVALVAAQLTAALHYLPVNPVAFGLVLLGPVYALSSLIVNLSQGQTARKALLEPAVFMFGFWLLALLFN